MFESDTDPAIILSDLKLAYGDVLAFNAQPVVSGE